MAFTHRIGYEQDNPQHRRRMRFMVHLHEAANMLYDPHDEITHTIWESHKSGELSDMILDTSNELFNRLHTLREQRNFSVRDAYHGTDDFGYVTGHSIGYRYYPGGEKYGSLPELLDKHKCEPQDTHVRLAKIIHKSAEVSKVLANPITYPTMKAFGKLIGADKPSHGTSGQLGAFILFGIPTFALSEVGQAALGYAVAGPVGLALPVAGAAVYLVANRVQEATKHVGEKYRSFQLLQKFAESDAQIIDTLTQIMEEA